MKVTSKFLLRRIFGWKGNLARGKTAAEKSFHGIEVARFKDDCPGAVSLSADFEMGWGWRSRPATACALKAATERSNVPYILQLLENYKTPITWATVGHLFLETCARGAGGRAHPEMPRPPRNERWSGDWYVHDPCSDLNAGPGWYAPDLVAAILASPVRHEMGTHSFSHIDFSRETSTPDLVREEISACIEAMAPFGAQPRSLVFCHNLMGHHYADLLYKLGIVVVRHRDPRIRLAYPERTASGVYNLYESMNLRLARHYNYADKAKIFIDEAVRRGTAFHIWFHPSDERRIFDQALAPILEYIDSRRRSGHVWVATMAEMAAYCEARETASIRVDRRQDKITLTFDSTLDTSRFGKPELTVLIPVDRPVKQMIGDQGSGMRELPVAAAGRTRTNLTNNRLRLSIPFQMKRLEIILG